MCQLAGAADLLIEVAVERDELVGSAVVDIAQFYFAERRADRRDVHAIFVFLMSKLDDLALSELHHILDAAAEIDETKAVVLQARGRKRGELLGGSLVIGGLIAKCGEHDLRAIGHGKTRRQGEGRQGDQRVNSSPCLFSEVT